MNERALRVEPKQAAASDKRPGHVRPPIGSGWKDREFSVWAEASGECAHNYRMGLSLCNVFRCALSVSQQNPCLAIRDCVVERGPAEVGLGAAAHPQRCEDELTAVTSSAHVKLASAARRHEGHGCEALGGRC
jgi:hypothetical protein